MTSWRTTGGGPTWIPLINVAEVKYGIPHDLLARQLFEECHWRNDIIDCTTRSTAGAVGIAQLLPEYFDTPTYKVGTNPHRDIYIAGNYLQSLYGNPTLLKDWQLALAAYDRGPTAIKRWLKADGKFEDLPKETRDYVSQIVADVPVEGVLCKIPSSLTTPVGSLIAKSSSAPSPAPPSAATSPTLLSRLSSRFIPSRPTTIPSPSPIAASASPSSVSSRPISRPNLNKGNPMSTPNPALVAAAPTMIAVLEQFQAMVSTITTGDPATALARVEPAAKIFLGQVELLLPGLATAEIGVLNSAVNSNVASLITKLQALTKAA